MKSIYRIITILLMFGLVGCATGVSPTSLKVIEYDNLEELSRMCKSYTSLGGVATSYNVFMHTPVGRNRAAKVRLREAAQAKGANAIIMTSNGWGVVTDYVQGIAYKCEY